MQNQTPQSLLRRVDVEARTKLSRSTLYSKINPKGTGFDPSFPAPIRIGTNSVRWLTAEIEAWIASRPRARGVVDTMFAKGERA